MVSPSPLDTVPPPVSAVDPLPPRQGHAPLARVVAAAALTTLDGQAVFRLISSGAANSCIGPLFRLRRRSRIVEVREP
jgi:hypothetical protein